MRCRRTYVLNKLSHVAMTQEEKKYNKDLVTYSKVRNCLLAIKTEIFRQTVILIFLNIDPFSLDRALRFYQGSRGI